MDRLLTLELYKQRTSIGDTSGANKLKNLGDNCYKKNLVNWNWLDDLDLTTKELWFLKPMDFY